MVHKSFASTGVISSVNSLPYKLNPASILRVSLDPKPHNMTFVDFINLSIKFFKIIFGIEISKPSSPVYPDLLIIISCS